MDKELKKMSGVFETIRIIDLSKNTSIDYSTNSESEKRIIDTNKNASAHAVINMGQLMSCEVISEGVENDSQVNYLKEYGCNMIQGFVWGKPLMYEDAKKLIEN